MNALAIAVLLVAVAYTSASVIGLGAAGLLGGHAGIVAPGIGIASARGAVEGALGGQWIPDVPSVASGETAKGAIEGALGGQWVPDVPVAAGAVVGHAGIGAPLALGLGGLGLAGHGLVASRGALEGALGGQWIPDTHGK